MSEGSSNDIIEDPGLKFRIEGQTYFLKGEKRIWDGKLWNCEHNKRKYRCKECGGTSICEHNRRKSQCIKCGGTSICEHNRRKSQCIECSGTSICEHNKHKYRCKECDGISICEHNREKFKCKECGGISICEHDRQKSTCKECGGISICKHNKQKYKCKECGGIAICKHNKQKSICKECGGSCLCKLCKQVHPRKRLTPDGSFARLCADCFYHTYPELKNVPSKYKRKQHYIHETLTEKYGENFFEYDVRISDSCSGKIPDWFRDLFTHCINIECDENQHKRQQSCDLVRLVQLWEDCAFRPYITIRFNPDKYIDSSGTLHKGCFNFDEKGVLVVDEIEFNRRSEILFNRIDYYLENIPEEMTPTEYLFFDDYDN